MYIGFKRTSRAPTSLTITGKYLSVSEFYYPDESYIRSNFKTLRQLVGKGWLECTDENILTATSAQDFILEHAESKGGGDIVPGIPEAPDDGKAYLRKGKEWDEYTAPEFPVIPTPEPSTPATDSLLYRRPLKRSIGIFGDSRTEMNHTVSANAAYATENYGYATWACMLSGLGYIPYQVNFGIGGNNTAEMLARIDPVVASDVDIILFLGSTNDRTAAAPTMSLGDSQRNILAIVRRLQRAGKIVIVGNETPRFGDKALTGQALADHLAMNQWITNELSKITPVVDTWSTIQSAEFLRDGLHPTVKGAAKWGAPYAETLKKLLFLPLDLPISSGDLYSALNKTGSLITNPLMIGSGNMTTASTNPVAGSQITTGYKAAGSNFAGVTTQWSKEARADGFGENQLIKFGGAATAAGSYLAFLPTAAFNLANMSVGDTISLMCDFEVSGNSEGILGITTEVIIAKPINGASTNIYYRDADKYTEPFTLPKVISKGYLESQRYTWDGTETSVTTRITVYLSQNVPQDTTVKIGRMVARKYL